MKLLDFDVLGIVLIIIYKIICYWVGVYVKGNLKNLIYLMCKMGF